MMRIVLSPFLAVLMINLTLILLPGPARWQQPAEPLSGRSTVETQWTVPTNTLTNTLVLAHWLGWFGLPNHRQPVPPYLANDLATIHRQINAATVIGIDGFIVDWLGPATSQPLSNNADRAFIDQATAALFAEAQNTPDFKIALMYDYAALIDVPAYDRTGQMSNDLAYARDTYLSHPNYLTVGNKSLLFLFPNQAVVPDVDLSQASAPLNGNASLIYQNPTTAPTIFPYVDGFFAWIQPTTADGWLPDGSDTGVAYLDWFYQTMATPPYDQKLTVGAVWPGFNDTLAPWRVEPPRFIARQEGQTWSNTWAAIPSNNPPPLVQIATWNDWEEGSAIEPDESHGTWAGPPIDTMDDISPWHTLSGANAVSITLSKRAGHDDGAVEMAYHVAESPAITLENWVQMRHDFNPALSITSGDLLRFWYKGTPGMTNTLEVGLVEAQAGQPILGRQLNHVTQAPVWVYTTLSYDAFVPWTTTITATSGQLDALFISVLKLDDSDGLQDVGGAGTVAIDGLQYLNAMSRPIPTAYESVVTDPRRARCAADWLAGQQQASGLLRSWAEEPDGKAWLYDQALALLVFSETNMAGAEALAARLATLQNPDGSWFDGYRPDAITSIMRLTDKKWVGSVAWVVYALARYVEAGGDSLYQTHAISGANWLKSQQMEFSDGRVHTSTEGTLDAWWAFTYTGLDSEADQAKDYLLNVAWRGDQQRWNRGHQDPVIVLDAQTWGAAFAKEVNEPERGLAALSFANYTLTTTSFSGTLRGLDGAGPFSVWNEGTAQYVVVGGSGAQGYLEQLRRQQGSNGALPGSPNDFHGGDVWLTRWHGVAPTAWYYFAETDGPFVAASPFLEEIAGCQTYLPVILRHN